MSEERRRQLIDVMKKVIQNGFKTQKETWRKEHPELYPIAAKEVRGEKIDGLLSYME